MKTKYDITIIGSGLGGLQSAVILSRKGYKVLVLEKNHQIGGALQSFKRKGCTFSTGMHYIGGLNKGETLHKIFSYFNLFDGIKYKKLDESGFDIFNIDGKEYKFAMGFENYKTQLCHYFPEEKTAINNYISEIKASVNTIDLYLLKKNQTQQKSTANYLGVSTWDHICSLTNNPQLQQVLSALNFVYAGVKEKSPFYLHALINYFYILSSYRIVGDWGQIAAKLQNEIIENGGEVITKKEVTNIIVENKKAVAVTTKDGAKYDTNNIISNVHPATTMGFIADGEIKKSFRNRMVNKENTMSGFAVYLNLKKNTVKYVNSNYNYYKRNDVWYASYYNQETWPEHFFMHYETPENDSEFTCCVGILTHMKYEEVEKWKNLPINKRGDEYLKFKNKKAEELIDLMALTHPQIKENIIDFTVSTPLTFNDYLGTPLGSLYGTLRDSNNPIGSYISPRTKISNLYFTGQNLNLHGMLGVSLSSIITCGEFVGVNNLLNEINEEKE